MNDIPAGYTPNLTKHFTIAVLNYGHAPAVAALMDQVRAALPEDQKHFLKPMTLSELRRHALWGNIIAAIDNQTGQFAGAFILTPVDHSCSCQEDKFAGYPRNWMSQDTAVVKVFVDTAYRGKGLMGDLLQAGEQLAAQKKFMDIIGKVAVENKGSNKGFGKANFNIVSEGMDPVIGYAVNYWYKTCSAAHPPLATAPIPRLNSRTHDNDSPPTIATTFKGFQPFSPL